MDTIKNSDTASFLRKQFRVLEAVGMDIRLDADAQRRVLLIAEEDWCEWSEFKQGGPLPAHPVVPVMLQRVAAATYRLAALVDRQVAAGQATSDVEVDVAGACADRRCAVRSCTHAGLVATARRQRTIGRHGATPPAATGPYAILNAVPMPATLRLTRPEADTRTTPTSSYRQRPVSTTCLAAGCTTGVDGC
jgi:hypothetical protein